MKRKRSMSKVGYFLAGIVTGLVTTGLFSSVKWVALFVMNGKAMDTAA